MNFVGAESHWTKAVVGVADGHGATVSADLSLCAATVASEDGTLSVPDMLAEERWRTHPFVTGEPGLRFYAGASIVVAGAPVGVVCVFGDRPRAITPRHRDALKALARQAARHLELRRLSLSDPLTGLPNRTLLFERLDAALARAGATVAWSASCSATSTTSSSSTIASATTPATASCARSPSGCAGSAGGATPSRASPETSSCSCARARAAPPDLDGHRAPRARQRQPRAVAASARGAAAPERRRGARGRR